MGAQDWGRARFRPHQVRETRSVQVSLVASASALELLVVRRRHVQGVLLVSRPLARHLHLVAQLLHLVLAVRVARGLQRPTTTVRGAIVHSVSIHSLVWVANVQLLNLLSPTLQLGLVHARILVSNIDASLIHSNDDIEYVKPGHQVLLAREVQLEVPTLQV